MRIGRPAAFAATCTLLFGTVVFFVHRIQQDERKVRTSRGIIRMNHIRIPHITCTITFCFSACRSPFPRLLFVDMFRRRLCARAC
jgi:hypothetical protein